MSAFLATFDPLIDIEEVVINGRFVFAHRFMRALASSRALEAIVVVGDVERNRRTLELGGVDHTGLETVQLVALDSASEVLKDPSLLALHSCLDKRLLGPMARVRAWAGASQVPLTVTAHGLAYPSLLPHLLAMLLAEVRPFDAIICPSESARRSLEAIIEEIAGSLAVQAAPTLGQVRLEVIPHGVDVTLFCPRDQAEARDRLDLPSGRPILLYVGRLNPITKAELWPVLSALAPLWNEPPMPLLYLVAPEENTYSETLLSLADRLGLEVRIDLDLSEQDLAWAYNAADLLLGVSDAVGEMFGLVVLEALASGTPVVATSVGGYRDLVEHERTGLLVDSYISTELDDFAIPAAGDDLETLLYVASSTAIDHRGLLDACRRLLNDQGLRRRLAEAGRELVVEGYSWNLVISRHLELWQELRAQALRSEPPSSGRAPFPYLPFSRAFSGYFSHLIDRATPLRCASPAIDLQDLFPSMLPMIRRLVRPEVLEWVLSQPGVWTMEGVMGQRSKPSGVTSGEVTRTVMWAIRQGLVTVAAHDLHGM